MENLKHILEDTITAVEDAAQFIQHEIGKIHRQDIETKALNSLVTYVDKESEKMLVQQLQEILPGSVFLTEENTISQQFLMALCELAIEFEMYVRTS